MIWSSINPGLRLTPRGLLLWCSAVARAETRPVKAKVSDWICYKLRRAWRGGCSSTSKERTYGCRSTAGSKPGSCEKDRERLSPSAGVRQSVQEWHSLQLCCICGWSQKEMGGLGAKRHIVLRHLPAKIHAYYCHALHGQPEGYDHNQYSGDQQGVSPLELCRLLGVETARPPYKFDSDLRLARRGS
jgi:hypothetical protein